MPHVVGWLAEDFGCLKMLFTLLKSTSLQIVAFSSVVDDKFQAALAEGIRHLPERKR